MCCRHFEQRAVLAARGCVGRVPDVVGAPMTQGNGINEPMTQIHDG